MKFGITFFIGNILLGAGLAMDAFSVSLANGMSCPKMKVNKMVLFGLKQLSLKTAFDKFKISESMQQLILDGINRFYEIK